MTNIPSDSVLPLTMTNIPSDSVLPLTMTNIPSDSVLPLTMTNIPSDSMPCRVTAQQLDIKFNRHRERVYFLESQSIRVL